MSGTQFSAQIGNDTGSRRKFLKLSGGATAATIVAWHGMTTQSSATGGHQGYPVTVKIKITIPAGETWNPDNSPDTAPPGWQSDEEKEDMGSGDSISEWDCDREDGQPLVVVNDKVSGPLALIYTRTITEGGS